MHCPNDSSNNANPQSKSLSPSFKPSTVTESFDTLFSALENEIDKFDSPLPPLKCIGPSHARKSEHKARAQNALAEAMQSQQYVARMKKMHAHASDPSMRRNSGRAWRHSSSLQFVPHTPSIPAEYKSKLHELDGLIPQLKYEHRAKLKDKQRDGIPTELRLKVDPVVPSQFLSPSFTVPDPIELPRPAAPSCADDSLPATRVTHKRDLGTRARASKPPSTPKEKTQPLSASQPLLFRSHASGVSTSSWDERSSSATRSAPVLFPAPSSPSSQWVLKHPVLHAPPTSSVNPKIEHLLSPFTQSVLKKCYLHDVHASAPAHRVGDATTKDTVDRTIQHVLSGTQKDDVERLASLLPIDWQARKILVNSKADITHQWKATHQLITKIDAAENQTIPNLIGTSRHEIHALTETKNLGNYSSGNAYVLERESHVNYDTQSFHLSFRDVPLANEISCNPSKFSFKLYLDEGSLSSNTEIAVGLHDEISELDDFQWTLDLTYMDEIQTFKACVVRLIRDVKDGLFNMSYLVDDPPTSKQKQANDDKDTVSMKSKITLLEKAVFPNELPKPIDANYQQLLYTLVMAMGMHSSCLSASATRLLCLITGGKVPSASLDACLLHLEAGLCDGTLAQQWASAYFLVRLRRLAPVLEYMKKRLGSPAPLAHYSVTAFLLRLPSQHFVSLATWLYPLMDHCSYHTRQDVVHVLHRGAAAWRQACVGEDWIHVIGTHRMMVPDDGDPSETVPEETQEEDPRPSPSVPEPYRFIHTIFRKLVRMMFEDWYVPIREKCADAVVALDLLPLIMLQLDEMMQSKEVFTKKQALRAIASMKWISTIPWKAYLVCFQSDYISIRIEACKTAKSLGLCHSVLIKELFKRCLDSEPRVRARAIHALPHVATNPASAARVMKHLIGLLPNELHPTVKLQGARALLHLLQTVQEKPALNPDYDEMIMGPLKALFTEWSTSEFLEDALLKKEAAKSLALFIGGNAHLLHTSQGMLEEDRLKQDTLDVVSKVRALSHRTQVLQTLMSLSYLEDPSKGDPPTSRGNGPAPTHGSD